MSETDNEYLTFILDGEEYGVDILCVQEIRVWSSVTDIPNTPSYMKGVINLRGIIVPIVDLRERFQREPVEYTTNTVVIVLGAEIRGKQVVVGIVVDAVSEVYKIEPEEVKEPPNFGSNVEGQFIEGMATIDEKIIILLNYTSLLDVDELYSLTEVISKAS